MRPATLIRLGAVTLALALIGWLVTPLFISFAAKPAATEDLTAQWSRSGPTPLGNSTSVTVPTDATLVAFLVGTDLYGIAGTTTGSCTAESGQTEVRLGHRVHINRSLTGILRDGQQTVAIAGWTNRTGAPVTVAVTCRSRDSTVEHFVAVPSRSAVVQTDPWFQPWGWLALGAAGALIIALGATNR